MGQGLGRTAAFALGMVAFAAAIIVCLSVDWRKDEQDVPVPAARRQAKPEQAAYLQQDAPPQPLPKSESAPSKRPYDGSNVFVRLPSGVIVRQGEEVPPLERESKSETELRAAADEWEKVVKACAGEVHGRKVDYADFIRALRRLPKEKRGENLKYAINLMDDANFLLIATLALDRTQPDELIALAFDACLNRDCASSRAVIEEISKDKSHPMYVDAARVMDIHRLSGRVGQ